jgi:hypothetical protein
MEELCIVFLNNKRHLPLICRDNLLDVNEAYLTDHKHSLSPAMAGNSYEQ